MKILLCCILIWVFHFKLATSENCFKSICIPSGYDKTEKPKLDYEQNYLVNFTNEIMVDFENILILGINEKESTISLKLSLSLWWKEPRLTISSNATKDEIDCLNTNVSGISLPKEFTNDLWLPDAYIEYVLKITKFNLIHDYQTFYFGIENGENWLGYTNEVEIDMFCRMTFESYPMDEQICYFLIGAEEYLELSGQLFRVERLMFIDWSEQLALQGYNLEINHLPKDKELYFDSYHEFHHQRTGFEIKFQHSFWKYLMNYYIPSGILVIFSWVSEKLKHITKNYIKALIKFYSFIADWICYSI